MPDLPLPLNATDITTLVQQTFRLMDDLYSERIGGALLGDVFTIGNDDILAVNVGNGLTKAGNALAVNVSSTGGLLFSSGALGIKLKAGGGLTVDVDGLYLGTSANHNILSSNHADTAGAAAVVAGDILYGNATPKWDRLALGNAAGKFLRVNDAATLPSWSTLTIPDTIAAGSMFVANSTNTLAALTATAGDLIYGNATPAWAKFAKGTAYQILRMNSGATAPEWAATIPRTATKVIAAYNSLDLANADYYCDGTNDEVQIQAAIAALVAGGVGGRIYCREGTYNIGATITDGGAKHIIIEGTYPIGHPIDATGGTTFNLAANVPMFQFAPGSYSILFKNIYFYLNRADCPAFKTTHTDGIAQNPVHNVGFDSCLFYYGMPALYLDSPWDFWFTNTNFLYCGSGATANRAAIYITTGTGADQAAGFRMSGCRFEPKVGYSIYVSGLSADMSILGTKFEGAGADEYPAIYGAFYESRFEANWFYGAKSGYENVHVGFASGNLHGAYDGGHTYYVEDGVTYGGLSYVALQTTTGNVPTNTTYWKVVGNSGLNVITGNTFSQAAEYNLYVSGNFNVVANNAFSATGTAHVYLDANSYRTIVAGNTMYDSVAKPIAVDAGNQNNISAFEYAAGDIGNYLIGSPGAGNYYHFNVYGGTGIGAVRAIYQTDGTKAIAMYHSGTHGYLSSATGDLVLGAGAGGRIYTTFDLIAARISTDGGSNFYEMSNAGDMFKADNLSGLANYTTARSNLGLAIGTNVQAYNSNLTAIDQALTTASSPTHANLYMPNLGAVYERNAADSAWLGIASITNANKLSLGWNCAGCYLNIAGTQYELSRDVNGFVKA